MPERPWDGLPAPLVRVALRGWSLLPWFVRRPLLPLGDLLNPGHVVGSTPMPGASTVDGVDALRDSGFTPIEELTGFVEVALVWPAEHRRSVRETRAWWLDEPLQGRLWLVRPPWSGWTPDQVLRLLWSVVDEHLDHATRLRVAGEVLRWTAERARAARPGGAPDPPA